MSSFLKLVVIKVSDYKDNDLLVQTLSEEYGRVSFIAKGTKKTTSKLAHLVQLYGNYEYEFDASRVNSLQVLKSGKIIETNRVLREDLLKQSIMALCCELINKTEEFPTANFLTFYQLLPNSEHPLLLLNLFLASYCQVNGFAPIVDECVKCNSNTNIETISVSDGGFICHNCNHNLPEYSLAILKQFRYIMKAQITDYEALIPYSANGEVVTNLLLAFIDDYAGINLVSVRFFKQLLNGKL